jgi:hypothetical protein
VNPHRRPARIEEAARPRASEFALLTMRAKQRRIPALNKFNPGSRE